MTELERMLDLGLVPFRRMSGEEITGEGRLEACRAALRESWHSDETTDRLLVLADGSEIPWEAVVAFGSIDASGVDGVLCDDVVYCRDDGDPEGIRMRAVYAASALGPLGPEVIWDADEPRRGPVRAGLGTHSVDGWADCPAYIYELNHIGARLQSDEGDGPWQEGETELMISCVYTDSDVIAYGLRG